MTRLSLAVLAASLLVAPCSLPLPAAAASAHNSQAGAYGPTSNNAARTYRHRKPNVATSKG